MATAQEVAQAYQARQSALQTATARKVAAQFGRLDEHALSESWAAGVGQAVQATVEQSQLAAAQAAAPYLAALAAAQGVPIPPPLIVASALAGIASDGRPLASLLYLPILLIKSLIKRGVKYPEAFRQGAGFAGLIASTQVADAGRAATTVGMITNPGWVSYVRVLRLPSCSRCIILAGREYSWSTGFQRHENCDCEMWPLRHDSPERLLIQTPTEIFNSMSEEDQDKRFGKAGAEAIRLGADPAQVVNARRGMALAQVFGRQALITDEGTTKRGIYGSRMLDQGAATVRVKEEFATRLTKEGPEQRRITRQRVKTPRLMPEAVIEAANGDREEAIRLLKRFAYILD